MGRTSRSTPAAGPLTRRRIAEAALAQIDAEGLEALSMRKLGAALGVEAMALYHHFANKGELLDAVLDLLIEEMEPPPPPATPLDRLRRAFEACRQIAIDHPQAFLLIATRRFRTPAQLDFYERLLGVFADAGFDAEASARFFRVLAGFVTGAGLAEIGSRGRQPDATPVVLESFSDPQRYPRVSAVVPHLKVSRLGRIFDYGLDLIFQAMRDAVRPSAAAGKRSPGSRGSKRPA